MKDKIRIRFMNIRTKEITDDSDLFVNPQGRVIRIYQDEDLRGDIVDYVADEDGVCAVVRKTSAYVIDAPKRARAITAVRPFADVPDAEFFGGEVEKEEGR